MTTLSELKVKFANKPVTLAAINQAISDNGADAEAAIVKGMASVAPQSNIAHFVKRVGWERWTRYAGARAGRHANDGYYNIIVKLD